MGDVVRARSRGRVVGLGVAVGVLLVVLVGGALALGRGDGAGPPGGELLAGDSAPGSLPPAAPGQVQPAGASDPAAVPDPVGAPEPAAAPEPDPEPEAGGYPRRVPGEPRWEGVPRSFVSLDRAAPRRSSADLYVPTTGRPGLRRGPLPVVVVLGRADVHASQYEQLGHEIAQYGFAVVVPERLRGAAAVRAAQDWASRARVATDDPVAVLAIGAAQLRAALRTGGPGPLAALLPAGGAVDGAHLGARPALVLTGDAPAVPGRRVVQVRRPGVTDLAVTVDGARGPAVTVSMTGSALTVLESHTRWFGTWFAAQHGDRLSQRFLRERLAATGPDADGVTVTRTGRLPW